MSAKTAHGREPLREDSSLVVADSIETLLQATYQAKSLVAAYRSYAHSFPPKAPEAPEAPDALKTVQREMKVAKEQLLKQLLAMQKLARKVQEEVKPSA